jgi:hypothetical protein
VSPEALDRLKAFVEDPEAHGGLSFLQDCGIDAIADLLDEVEDLRRVLWTYARPGSNAIGMEVAIGVRDPKEAAAELEECLFHETLSAAREARKR